MPSNIVFGLILLAKDNQPHGLNRFRVFGGNKWLNQGTAAQSRD